MRKDLIVTPQLGSGNGFQLVRNRLLQASTTLFDHQSDWYVVCAQRKMSMLFLLIKFAYFTNVH
jgi:hypothetical protein